MTYEQYLFEHGISKESVINFGLYQKDNALVIPVKDESGELLFEKERFLDYDKDSTNHQQKFKIPHGSKQTLYNAKALSLNKDYVIISSGEIDCIKLSEEGYQSVIASTTGEGSFPEEYIPRLKGKKVFILMDSDEAGERAVLRLKEIFPSAFVIRLPSETKDVCEYFRKYTKRDFGILFQESFKSQVTDFEGLCNIFDKWLLLPDKNVLKVVMSTIIAHHFTSDPLWLLLIAPPSGSKTEIIQSVSSLPFTYFLSDLTAQTFVSGFKAKEDPSLLTKLKNEIILMKDFTTVLSMRGDDRQIILGQLREIYDGKYSKNFGTGKRVEWEGRLGFIGGVTSIVDTYSSVFQVMGERFILYRIPQSEDEETAQLALSMGGKEKNMRAELKEAVSKYFKSLRQPAIEDILLPQEIIVALSAVASFVVKARSGIIRDYRKEIEYIPEPEAPARFAKQLGTFIKGLCVVEGRSEVTWDDLMLTVRVALDAIPTNRIKHILALCNDDYQTTKQIQEITRYSISGSQMILEDLRALGLVDSRGGGMGITSTWIFSDRSKKYFGKFFPKDKVDSDKVKKFFEENSTYSPLIEKVLT